MGDNYYLHAGICPHCRRSARTIHIGKSSGGWTFSFRGYRHSWEQPLMTSWKQWQDVLRAALAEGGEIRDEYDVIVSLEDFMALVKDKEQEPRNHTLHCQIHHPEHARECWLDEEGHSFIGTEFS